MNKQLTLLTSSVLMAGSAFAGIVSLDNATFSEITSPSVGEYNITEDMTLTSDNEYILQGNTFVMPGVTLTIQPGTIVRGQPQLSASDVPGSLVVTRGGEIYAVGTPSSPIIFTTAADTNRERWTTGDAFLDADPKTAPLPPSDGTNDNVNLWGAVTLLGYSTVNRSSSPTGVAGTAYIEGYTQNDSRTIYGGLLPNDSSGSIAYVSIRHTGNTTDPDEEQQGLTLGGVGSGTRLDHIDIYCSGDDGIEIFGGTANLKYFILSYFDDDGLDLDQGYTGLVQFGFIIASNYTPNASGISADKLGEWDGEDPANIVPAGQPFGCPTIYNITMFGPNSNDFGGFLDMKEGFGGNFFNSILAYGGTKTDVFNIQTSASTLSTTVGFPSLNPQARAQAGTLNVAGTLWYNVAGNVANNIGANSIADAFLNNNTGITPGAQKNVVGTNPLFGAANGGLANDQTVSNGLNPVPLSGAVILPAAGVPVTNTFFSSVNYIGAFPPDTLAPLFTTGWTALNLRGVLVDNAAAQNLD